MGKISEKIHDMVIAEFAGLRMAGAGMENFTVEFTDKRSPYNENGVCIKVFVEVDSKYNHLLGSIVNFDEDDTNISIRYDVFVAPIGYESFRTEIRKAKIDKPKNYFRIADDIKQIVVDKLHRLAMRDEEWGDD